MPHFSLANSTRVLLLAGAATLALAAAPASAQGYGPYGDDPGYDNGPPEDVIVTAPHFRSETAPLNAPLEKVSLSTHVPYSDLDLASRSGARELRLRVREAARQVCGELADAYPVYQMNGTSCFKTALENGLVRANAAITTARQQARDEYYEGYED
jgi:UrcA family protein